MAKKQSKNKEKPNKKKSKAIIRAKSVQQFKSNIKVQANEIKNKQKRVEVHAKRKVILRSIQNKQKKQRMKLPANERQKPITIEDKTHLTEEHRNQYDEEQFDEFNQLLNDDEPVKVLITTCIKPAIKIYSVIRELMMVFHNIFYYPRHRMKLEDVYEYAHNLKFTHVVIVRYSQGWELLIKHTQGIQAAFRLTSLEFQKDIKHHALATDHVPQLILNNFDSKVGIRTGRLLASLFPQNPDFKGRRVVTFHNQRDFIFFRHHRYIFREGFQGVNMQQIGPSFTLQLKNILTDSNSTMKQIQFNVNDNMYVNRKATYL